MSGDREGEVVMLHTCSLNSAVQWCTRNNFVFPESSSGQTLNTDRFCANSVSLWYNVIFLPRTFRHERPHMLVDFKLPKEMERKSSELCGRK